MIMKKDTLKYILLSLTFFTLFSCKNRKVENYKLIFEFDKKLEDFEVGEPMPNNLVSIMEYYEPEEDNDNCSKFIFAPKIEYIRTDLEKKEVIGIPLKAIKKFQQITGTLSPINLKEGYDTSLLIIPKLLIKDTGNIKSPSKSKNKNKIFVSINDSKEAYDNIKKQIHKELCEKGIRSFTIVVNQIEPDSIGKGGPKINPCQVKTLDDAQDLKAELLKIIDTSLSDEERDDLAKKVWATYFDDKAYIERRLYQSDPNGSVWKPGQGIFYFTDRIAVLESITDINIIRIERSKKTGKISGIILVECHNASEIQ